MSSDERFLNLYAQREQLFQRSADRAARLSLGISWARAVVAFVGIAAAVAGFQASDVLRVSAFAGAGVAFVAFVALVAIHASTEARLRWNRTLALLNHQQAARVRRDWAAVPRLTAAEPDRDHPYARDLDLLGRASLFEFLGPSGTPAGQQTLQQWLLDPADAPTIGQRQEAVAELSPRLHFRQELLARGTMAGSDRDRLQRFLTWAEGPPWFITKSWLVWTTRLVPALLVALIALQSTGTLDRPFWLPIALAAVLLRFAVRGHVDGAFGAAFGREDAATQDAHLFGMITGAPFGSPLLRRLQQTLTYGDTPADRLMVRLKRLSDLAELRYSTLIHFVVNTFTLWDFHVVYALERWQTTAGRHVRTWIDSVGEVEALCALAGLHHDNPDWAFPEVTPSHAGVIEARELAHPLLQRGVRVANDVRVGPTGTFLFVTGSNMSGKSTLLRAIGTNIVLAQAGGPVCATHMQLPPLAICTSIRVQDSLEEGVSYYMAALTRLKTIVDVSQRVTVDGSRTLLYLLDEILQGTNTAERQIAVRRVLRHLNAQAAIGVVTSHDLALADEDGLRETAVAVHFSETFDDTASPARLTFDYRLNPGVATSSNALVLMRLMGL
jgi:hypothetical protein